jgi:hypothetical protein
VKSGKKKLRTDFSLVFYLFFEMGKGAPASVSTDAHSLYYSNCKIQTPNKFRKENPRPTVTPNMGWHHVSHMVSKKMGTSAKSSKA